MAQLPKIVGSVEVSQAIGLGVDDFGLLCADLQVELVSGKWQAKVPHVRAYRINKWSKRKPVKFASPIVPTDAQVKAQNYGLSIPQHSYSVLRTYALTTLDIEDESTQYKWTYLPPTGTATDPFRIDDFSYYQHASLPVLSPEGITRGGAGVGISWDAYGLCKWTMNIATASQPTGGLTPDDFNNWDIQHLGVMLIDYENTGNPIVLIKANDASIQDSQTIIIDITDLNAATYIVCLFLYSNELGGFAQIDNPTTQQIEAISGIFYLNPLENGMRAAGLTGFVDFDLWVFGAKGARVSTPFATNDYYTLYNTNSPTLNVHDILYPTLYDKMVWNSLSNVFNLETKATFNPTHVLKWELEFSVYLAVSSNWSDNMWHCLVSWDDLDGTTVSLIMKTVLADSNHISLAFYQPGNDSEDYIRSSYDSNVSISESTPVIIKLTYIEQVVDNITEKYIALSINGVQVLTDATVYSILNTPYFSFGDTLDDLARAPYGLGMNYIDLRATGSYT